MSVSYHSAEWLSGANQSRSGGIGRRAWFRSMYPQGCGGSSPFFGTIEHSEHSEESLSSSILFARGACLHLKCKTHVAPALLPVLASLKKDAPDRVDCLILKATTG